MNAMSKYDLIVVGSGGGALVAACTAALSELRVAILEATDRLGGTTAYSGGGMWFPDNAVLRRAGNVDSVAEAKAYFHAVVGDRTPRDLQDAFVETGRELVDYLESNGLLALQVYPWPDYYGLAPNSRPEGRHINPEVITAGELGAIRSEIRERLPTERRNMPSNEGEGPGEVLWGGQALIGRLRMALAKFDSVDIHRRTELTSLRVADGKVAGVTAVTPEGREIAFDTGRGVILAAGGFERNDAMRRKFGVPTPAAWSMGSPGNLGKAHQAAMDIGADTDLMEECWWAPGLVNPDHTTWFLVGIQRGLLVNAQGRRFADETLPYDRLGREMLRDHGRADASDCRFWLIFDDRDEGALPIVNTTIPVTDRVPYEEAGLWHEAASLKELAAKIGVDGGVLQETVARFNAFAATGKDLDHDRGVEPYGRFFAEGDGPNPALLPVDRAPYHAVAIAISDLGTKGGLKTDRDGRVLDTSGAAIAGLYAAGNTMAAVSGLAYPAGGNPIGASMVFGYRAARHAASLGR